MGGLISGILGGGNSSGQEQQMQALKASRGDIQAYRPEAMQARLNALRNMTDAYGGGQNALETLWGAPQQPQTGLRGNLQAMPRRMMGHDLPQQMPQLPQQPQDVPDEAAGFFDPLNIFGER
jgi:hypothetical protein